jgi:hypothetical protein
MRWVPLALATLGCGTALALAPAAASATWGAPERISPSDRAAYASPAVAAGRGGSALAAWIRTPAGARPGAGRVQLAARLGRGWSRPRSLSGPGASLPRAALDAHGDAVAAWRNDRLIVAAVRRGPLGSWRRGRVAQAGAPVQDVVVAIDRRGRPAAAWVERRARGFEVRLATADPGGVRWTVRAARLSTPGPEPPAVALSPGRGALAAWVDDGRVLASRTVAGAFERPVELSDPDASAPGIALGGTGAALASWSVRLPGGTEMLQAAGRLARAPRWGAPEDVGIGRVPAVGVNELGDAVVAWGTGEPGGEQSLTASTRHRRGLWRASTIVPRRECRCELNAAAAAVDGTGRSVVSWRRDGGRSGAAAGAAALAADGHDWEAAPIPATRGAVAAAVAAAPTSGVAAVWSINGSGGGIRASQNGR